MERLVMKTFDFKLLAIIVLNALDGLLTYLGVSCGYCEELNPIVRAFIYDFGYVLLFKILFPTILVCAVWCTVKKYGIKRPQFVNFCVTLGLSIYVFILVNHAFVLAQLAAYQ